MKLWSETGEDVLIETYRDKLKPGRLDFILPLSICHEAPVISTVGSHQRVPNRVYCEKSRESTFVGCLRIIISLYSGPENGQRMARDGSNGPSSGHQLKPFGPPSSTCFGQCMHTHHRRYPWHCMASCSLILHEYSIFNDIQRYSLIFTADREHVL